MARKKKYGQFYGGISGLQVPVPKYQFPEEHRDSSRLKYYSTFFKSIEINSSFYRLPQAATVSKWCREVPDDFKFTYKLWRDITHVKHLAFKESDVVQFYERISAAGDKKGCVLIQFPPSLGSSQLMQLRELLSCIERTDPTREWKIAVEFRNSSWYEEDLEMLCRDHKVAIVLQDIPKSRTPMMDQLQDFVYLRFHGPTGNYRDSYTEELLSEYAISIREWMEEGKDVYAYFNNTMGAAFANLQTLSAMVLKK
jgi:uncharacterized protein YecE (DUF72 family)